MTVTVMVPTWIEGAVPSLELRSTLPSTIVPRVTFADHTEYGSRSNREYWADSPAEKDPDGLNKSINWYTGRTGPGSQLEDPCRPPVDEVTPYAGYSYYDHRSKRDSRSTK